MLGGKSECTTMTGSVESFPVPFLLIGKEPDAKLPTNHKIREQSVTLVALYPAILT